MTGRIAPAGFNPRSRMGSDELRWHLIPRASFNPRSRMGSDWTAWRNRDRARCFNPRSRMGSDDHSLDARHREGTVSIHAPAWGATEAIGQPVGLAIGFNPRSRMGSDRLGIGRDPKRCFNPRSRMGSDSRCRSCPDRRSCFNPRSRMGSDGPAGEVRRPGRGFNPRSRMGSDLPESRRSCKRVSIHAPAWGATSRAPQIVQLLLFQSTLPHGERHRRPGQSLRSSSRFNPRSRMGSDGWSAITSPMVCGFNPRSRMGSDGRSQQITGGATFQSTLPHGERPGEYSWLRAHPRFQSTLPHGERPLTMSPSIRSRSFNPRSRMGSDLRVIHVECPVFDVSIHAPAWGATSVAHSGR